MKSYRELVVWQRSMDLVEEVYRLLKRLPPEERYALAEQMRRAVISIPSNIAEGYARQAPKDYARFLVIARGSKYEIETQLSVCERLNYLTKEDTTTAFRLCDEIGKMLNTILAKILSCQHGQKDIG